MTFLDKAERAEDGASGVRSERGRLAGGWGRRDTCGRESSLVIQTRRDTGVEPQGPRRSPLVFHAGFGPGQGERPQTSSLEQLFCLNLSGRNEGGSELLSESRAFINNLKSISQKDSFGTAKFWVLFNIEFEKCVNCNFSLSSIIKCEF